MGITRATTKKKAISIKSSGWQDLAARRLKMILREAQKNSTLGKASGGLSLGWQVAIHLVNRPRMAALNETYRGKSYPTDVLSFPAPDLFRRQGMLGELIICLPVLKAQAKELGHPPEIELEVLLIHGVLHLLGYDHEKNRAAAIRMAALENALLQKTLRPADLRSANHLGLIDRTGSGKKLK